MRFFVGQHIVFIDEKTYKNITVYADNPNNCVFSHIVCIFTVVSASISMDVKTHKNITVYADNREIIDFFGIS